VTQASVRLPAWLKTPIRLPLAGWPLALFVAAFLLPGLVGHDPWKTEDAVGFGVVHQMTSSGDWLAPHLAGEPFYEDGPLYFWVAGGFVLASRASSRRTTPHRERAFIATLCCALAARELYGKREGDLSVLADGLRRPPGTRTRLRRPRCRRAGCGYYGVAISDRRSRADLLRAGTAVAFLAKDSPRCSSRSRPHCCPPAVASFRQRNFAFSVGLGLAILARSPRLATARRARPAYFEGWLAWQLMQVSHPPRLAAALEILKTLVWAAWPVWPLTAWATWEFRRQLREPGFAVPFVATIVSLVLLLFMGRPREMDMLRCWSLAPGVRRSARDAARQTRSPGSR
jgi:hypothetical protein